MNFGAIIKLLDEKKNNDFRFYRNKLQVQINVTMSINVRFEFHSNIFFSFKISWSYNSYLLLIVPCKTIA